MRIGFLVLSVSLLAAAACVHASPVTFGFSGIVTQVPFDDLGTGIAPGAAFSGQYTFDSAAVDGIANPAQGSYSAFGPSFGLSVTIDGNLFALTGFLNVGVGNGLAGGVDQYTVFASDGNYDVSIFFEDPSGTAFASDALPLVAPAVAGFAVRTFTLIDVAGVALEVGGQIDTLNCLSGCGAPNPVPEPGSLALLGVALLAGAATRRR